MKPERIMLCLSVKSNPKVDIRDATHTFCAQCETVIWVAPSSLLMENVTKLCQKCFAERAKGLTWGDMQPLTEKQREEVNRDKSIKCPKCKVTSPNIMDSFKRWCPYCEEKW